MNNLYLKRLTLHNFKTFEHVDLEFKPNSSYLIVGENRDAAGMNSNESGKSNLVSAVPWLITGQVTQNIAADSIIRRGTDQCYVSAIFEDISNGCYYFIERGRGKTDYLQLMVNDVWETRTTSSATQAFLFELFGLANKPAIAFNDLCNTVFFSSLSLSSFASSGMTSGKRLELIARFLKLFVIDAARKQAVDKANSLREKLNTASAKVQFIEESLEKYDLTELHSHAAELEQIIARKSEVLSGLRKQHEIFVLKDELQGIEDRISKAEESYTRNKKHFEDQRISDIESLEQYEKVLCKEKELQGQENLLGVLENKLRDEEELAQETESAISERTREINDIENKIAAIHEGIFQCPACRESLLKIHDGSHIIVEDGKDDLGVLGDLPDNLQSASSALSKLNTAYSVHNEQIEKLKSRIEPLLSVEDSLREIASIKKLKQAAIERKEKTDTHLNKLREDYELDTTTLNNEHRRKKSRLAILELKTSTYEYDKLSDLDKAVAEAKEDYDNSKEELIEIKTTIKNQEELRNSADEYSNVIIQLKKQVKSYEVWETAFPEIKKHLMACFFPELEKRVNYYLSLLEIELRIEFDFDMERLRNELIINVIENGSQVWNFEERSRGMQTRIACAIGSALADTACFDRPVGLAFMFYDETLDSLDEIGVEAFLRMISNVEKQHLFISHANHLQNRNRFVDETILVTKEQGISRIQQLYN